MPQGGLFCWNGEFVVLQMVITSAFFHSDLLFQIHPPNEWFEHLGSEPNTHIPNKSVVALVWHIYLGGPFAGQKGAKRDTQLIKTYQNPSWAVQFPPLRV